MPKKDERGGLMGLKATLKLPSIPRVPPVQTTPEMERQLLGADTAIDQLSNKDVSTDVKTPTSTLPSFLVRQKEPTVLMNAKLPLSLHRRLKRTAQYNDISMTDILIRALENELATGGYTAPPETWGSK